MTPLFEWDGVYQKNFRKHYRFPPRFPLTSRRAPFQKTRLPRGEKPMKRSISVFVIVCLASFLSVVPVHASNVVVDWNSIASTVIITNGTKPSVTSAVWFAYVQLAVYDAVNAISHRYEPFLFRMNGPVHASKDAAAIAAAHRILVNYFPSQSASLDALYTSSIAAVTDNVFDIQAGTVIGDQAARTLIAARAHD